MTQQSIWGTATHNLELNSIYLLINVNTILSINYKCMEETEAGNWQ